MASGLQQSAGDQSWRIGKAKGPRKGARASFLPSRGLYCPAAMSHHWLHKFWPRQKGGTGKKTMLGPSWRGNRSGMWGLRP